ncbi:MAG TPA: hypothetical protein VEY51_02270 [Chondromyces sp.]|nr:hypothetical protein [Chondromyces sp.]
MINKGIDKNVEPENGSMASNFEEMHLLGNQMERQRTNKELKEDKRLPDPIQSNDEEDRA